MPHHEYVENVLQEIEIPDKIENNETKSYFVCAEYNHIYAKDRAFVSSNTTTAIYADRVLSSVYRSIISEPGYPYKLIIREFLSNLLV